MNGTTRRPAGIRRGRQRGLTLTELLVALLLGLLLTAGMIQVFIGNRVSYAFNESLSRIQENGRFSLEHMTFMARMAGYSGCLSEVMVHNNLNGPDNFRDDIANGLQGFNANGTSSGETLVAASTYPAPSTNAGDWTPALPAELVNRVIPGSDVLVIRSVSGDAKSLVTPFSDSGQLFISEPHDYVEGEVLVATDCQKASIFQVSNVQDAGGGKVNLVHSNNSMTPGNSQPVWGSDQTYGLGSEVARLQSYAFYVGRGANNAPALFQLRLARQNSTTSTFVPEELVAGIETLQIRYGLDGDGDGDVDSFVSADAVGNWATVLSVEMSLVSRASDEYGTEVDTATYDLMGVQFDPVDDRRLRQLFSTTVGIRNRLP